MSHDNCEHPESRPKVGKCSEEQINKCHGSKDIHFCDSEKQEYQRSI